MGMISLSTQGTKGVLSVLTLIFCERAGFFGTFLYTQWQKLVQLLISLLIIIVCFFLWHVNLFNEGGFISRRLASYIAWWYLSFKLILFFYLGFASYYFSVNIAWYTSTRYYINFNAIRYYVLFKCTNYSYSPLLCSSLASIFRTTNSLSYGISVLQSCLCKRKREGWDPRVSPYSGVYPLFGLSTQLSSRNCGFASFPFHSIKYSSSSSFAITLCPAFGLSFKVRNYSSASTSVSASQPDFPVKKYGNADIQKLQILK